MANPSINTDWLTAGFARLQPAGYVKRYPADIDNDWQVARFPSSKDN
jgi:hypothetical protein